MTKIPVLLLLMAMVFAVTSAGTIMAFHSDKSCKEQVLHAKFQSRATCSDGYACNLHNGGQYEDETCVSSTDDPLQSIKGMFAGSFLWQVEYHEAYCSSQTIPYAGEAMMLDTCLMLFDGTFAMFSVQADGTIVENIYYDQTCKTGKQVLNYSTSCDSVNHPEYGYYISNRYSIEQGTKVSGGSTIQPSLIVLSILIGLSFIQL